jgi:acyl-CoA synthetase (NDP forming)
MGLNVVRLRPETIRKLDAVLPPWWNRGNPVDLVAGLSRSSVRGCLETLAGAEEVDGVLMLGLGFGSMRARLLEKTEFYKNPALRQMCDRTIEEDLNSARVVLECIERFQKPILVVSEGAMFSAEDRKGSLEILESNGIFPYPSFRRGAEVMKRLIERKQFLEKVSDERQIHSAARPQILDFGF